MADKRVEIYQNMGERIKSRRLELGLTQVDVSLRLGIPQQSYSDIELGTRHTRLDRIAAIAHLFRSSPCWFAFGIGKGGE
jgi:transcriptional regulator with XRE-family HTH domain